MANTVAENLADAGKVVEKNASAVGSKISSGAGKAVEIAKETAGMETKNLGLAGLQDHMKVYASCGKQVGVVDHLDGTAIKLTRKDSPDGQPHYIPASWVAKVDSHVHLNKNSQETENSWSSSSEACSSFN